MKIKIFSVKADESFSAIRVGQDTRTMSANEYLEREIQGFLDENPHIQIKHVQYSAIPIVPRNASWNTTNTDIDWEIEKSVIIFFDED